MTQCLPIAERLLGTTEVPGRSEDNPLIVAMHHWGAQSPWFNNDEVPWCSSFVCFVARLARRERPRTAKARARSWLTVGHEVKLDPWLFQINEVSKNTVAIFARGSGDQPGPEVLDAPGHVGFLVDWDPVSMSILGGNQSDSVTIERYPMSRLLGVRHLPSV